MPASDESIYALLVVAYSAELCFWGNPSCLGEEIWKVDLVTKIPLGGRPLVRYRGLMWRKWKLCSSVPTTALYSWSNCGGFTIRDVTLPSRYLLPRFSSSSDAPSSSLISRLKPRLRSRQLPPLLYLPNSYPILLLPTISLARARLPRGEKKFSYLQPLGSSIGV